MHAEMTAASEKRKRAARERVARRQGVTLPRFTEGDFVLAATATGKSGNKLALLYREAARGQVEELTEQAIHEEGGHLVEALRACRLSPDTQQWELQVKWFGLDEVETSWEPAEVIKEDVPVLFARFVDEKPDDPDRLHMTETLDARAGRLPTAATALPVPKKRRRKRATPAV
ncbi:hypothetical protein PR003_g34141 [Phytophthora rubi]|uniref:Chromo domain-containing protein n=1 Tax=Phytophthora rubi TaxID=129364 RepID=A0A6A4AMV9_9STRA|nr:hypothetical protein PR003_g34141 [Phytophthora rubi]